MKSRSGMILLAICCMSLAGCANWQNRAGRVNAPGNAASLDLSTPPPPGPLLTAPGMSPGEPPPPVPPASSDPFLTLPPMESNQPSGQRLNLSSADSKPAAAPKEMYNLESPEPKRKTATSEKAAEPARKSSTISRLAQKSETKPKASEPEAEPKSKAVASRSSALDRLSRASQEAAPDGPTPTSLPRPSRVEEPAPAPAAAAAPAATEDAAVDTTLLAQPVRKGADAGEASAAKESKGPQSSLIPSGKLFNTKPLIYPVSNPVVEDRIDITQFS